MRHKLHDQYTHAEYIEKIYQDSGLGVKDLCILASAIFIASIGLNMNSVAAIIGAMLISPLMSPILGIGVGLANYNSKLINRAASSLGLEVGISIFVSTMYFYFSPLSYASAQILARTSPTIWDALIALFGGIAGIIGSRQKSQNNVVPGVAIATALMPPLCTMGYGISIGNWHYAFGAAYLFIINTFFLILTSFLGTKIMQKSHAIQTNKTKRVRWLVLLITFLLLIPSLISAHSLVEQSVRETNVKMFVAQKFGNATVIQQNVNQKAKVINITTTGTPFSPKEIKKIQNALPDYGLSGYHLQVNQIAELSQLSNKEFETYVNKLIAKDRAQNQIQLEKSQQELFTKMNKQIKAIDENDINSVLTSTAYQNGEQVYLVEIELKDEISSAQKAKIKKAIQNKYPHVIKISFSK